MNWLRPAVFLACLSPAALVPACSGDDSANPSVDLDASQPPIPKIEAGAPCTTNNDCITGLSCLYPSTTCEQYRECTPTPPSPCPAPQTACSCLGETIQVCNGFASDPIDSMGACPDGGTIVLPEGGADDDAPFDASPPPDSSDAAGTLDASDSG